MLSFLLILPCMHFAFAEDLRVRYDNFNVHRIIPETTKQLEVLKNLENNAIGYDFWSGVTNLNEPVDIMVPPHLQRGFEKFSSVLNLTSSTRIKNVQELVDQIQPANATRKFDWRNYYPLETINNWLKELPSKYPQVVTLIQGGKSYEGRPIVGVKVSFKSGNKGVFIEGGIHAREWISPATITYILNELLTSEDSAVKAIARNKDWYIFPIINPDGYVHSHVKARFWRKNRRPIEGCVGVDLNRNWDYRWMHGGASNDPCSEIYAGPSAFSESETKSLSQYISSVARNLDSYISFHSYSQVLLIPFGHQGNEVPENNQELHKIGQIAMTALAKRYGTAYRILNIKDFSIASGSSLDWALGTNRHLRIPFVYELRDKGRYGFALPKEQIIPCGQEVMDSLVSIFQQIKG